MMEQMPQAIDWISIFVAGLRYSINPTSFLGYFLFMFLVVRIQKLYRMGILFGTCLVLIYFIMQAAAHLGLLDGFNLYASGFSLVCDAVRVLLAIGVLIFGILLFQKVLTGSQDGSSFLAKFFDFSLTQDLKISFLQRVGVILKSFFWGLFFLCFCGMWPLDASAVDLIYHISTQITPNLFWQFIFFQAIAFSFFLGILFCLAKIFTNVNLYEKLVRLRIVMIVFSALCVASGSGMLIHYLVFFI